MDSYSEIKRDGTRQGSRKGNGVPGTLHHGVPGLVTHTSSLSVCEKSKSEGQLWLHNEFQASLGDMLRSCLYKPNDEVTCDTCVQTSDMETITTLNALVWTEYIPYSFNYIKSFFKKGKKKVKA